MECALLLPIFVLEIIGYAILSPVLRKGARLGIPRRFTIADFAALLLYIQLALTLTYYYHQVFKNSIGVGAALTIMGIAIVVLWGAAVSTLNQLELHTLLRRALFLLVLLPGVIAVMGGLPLVLLHSVQNDYFRNSRAGNAWIAAGCGGVVLAGIALHLLGSWLVKDVKVIRGR